MRKYKMRSLLLLALLAICAMAGASVANATTGVRSGSLTGAYYTGAINAELAKYKDSDTAETATLTAGSGSVRCTTNGEDVYPASGSPTEGSWLTGSVSTPNPSTTFVAGSIMSLTFRDCTDSVFGQVCTVTVNAQPYTAQVTAVDNNTGTMDVFNVSVTISGCNFLNCTFTSSKVTAKTFNPGVAGRPDTTGPDNGAAQAYFNGVALTGSGSNCWVGTSGQWFANYAVRTGSSPGAGSNVFVTTS